MALSTDIRPIKAYLILILAWVILYAVFDSFAPHGSGYIAFSTFFFFTEFAVIFVLALVMGGELSEDRGMAFKDIVVQFLLFFAVFAAAGLLATLFSAVISLTGSPVISIVIFLVLAIVKFLLGLAGLLIGAYLRKAINPKSAGSYRNMLLTLSACILFAVGAFSYVGGMEIAQSISFTSSPGYSDTLANCAVGEWGFGNFFGATLNTTVQGITAYRGRQACHANGSGTVYGFPMTYDSYTVTSGDYCTVTVTASNGSGTTTRERCYGPWPGYNSTG